LPLTQGGPYFSHVFPQTLQGILKGAIKHNWEQFCEKWRRIITNIRLKNSGKELIYLCKKYIIANRPLIEKKIVLEMA
jgi:hypothetical protein